MFTGLYEEIGLCVALAMKCSGFEDDTTVHTNEPSGICCIENKTRLCDMISIFDAVFRSNWFQL